MTTNKPEVVYATNLYSSAPVACLMRRTGEKAEPVIRLSDYEALQAECEKLRKRARTAEHEYSKTLRSLEGLERLAKVVSDNSDEVCSENNQLRVECEKLRNGLKNARYRIEQGRIWNGMGWSLTGLHAYQQQRALDEIDAAMQADNPC